MRLKDVFVQNLRKYRKDRKISQMALADLCNTSTSYIGQIEIGNRFPSVDMIERIAEALQIRPHLLFFVDIEENPKEMLPNGNPSAISDAAKNELVKRLTDAIRRIVMKMN